MNLSNLTVKAFLDELASGSPAPGGGSTAALAGALGTALSAMVARLTLGREKLRDSWPVAEEAAAEADRLRARFLCLVDEDAEAYLAVAAARKLPKATEIEREARGRAVGTAVLRSARVPLETLLLAGQAVGLAARLMERGNPSCISDAGSAVQAARLAAEAAAYNVRINLPDIADAAERTRLARETDAALASVRSEADRLAGIVETLLGRPA
ncbi:MAG: cyclodeaminase/cyclohydrolase family protein [Spirochaetes bacterium]|jgi:glutamate formiminotransferase/formiminotetrahydrofolate cyclodeaminase|nr:cyclodeaminase/cyclohydrolase family protein [Spirochaetota bacterium]